MELFGSSGVRGVVGDGFTADLVVEIAAAAGTLWTGERAAVARDTRTSGDLFVHAATAGLTSAGLDVDRLGVVPTPGVARYCEAEGVPAVVVTASHNPPEYNGLKLVGADGVELPVDELERVEAQVRSAESPSVGWQSVGTSRQIETANDDYVADLLSAVDRDRIAAADLTVAIDPGHGAGALTTPEFFRRLGCEVVTVNAQADGRFPGRQPEPLARNLADLRRLVDVTDADLGVAHDGDADRAIFVDETGSHVDGEASFAALAAAELDPGATTVSAVNVSQRLVDVCDDVGATLELAPIGATHIITRVRQLQARGERTPVAGEGNGGVFFPDYRLVRDGAYTAARFLELVAERPASEVVAPYAGYHNVRANLTYDSSAELEAMLSAAAAYVTDADAVPDTTDGYRLDFGDAWVLVRQSGTEPKVRIYAEARESERARSLVADVESALEAARA